MNRKQMTGVTFAGIALTIGVTACQSGGTPPAAAVSSSSVPAQAAAPASSAPPSVTGATCAQAHGTIKILVNAQAAYNASQQAEADDFKYVINLEMGDAIIHVGGPAKPGWSPAGSGQLNHDLYQFNADVGQFTQGDTTMLSTVGSDIGALAADCGISVT